MNRFLIFMIVMFSLAIAAKGQHNYAEAVQQGDAAYNNGQYKLAINKYFAAEAFDPSKKEEVKAKVNKVFNRVEQLRIEADSARLRANTEKNKAIAAKKEVVNSGDAFRLVLLAKEKAKEDPTIALRIAEAALQKHHDDLILHAAQEIFEQNEIYFTRDSDSNGIERRECAAVSRDGSVIATANHDGIVRLWTSDCRFIKQFKGEPRPIMSIAFSPDGNSILTGNYDHTAVIWNTISGGKKVYTFKPEVIRAVAFSPDGSKFVTGSVNGTAALWDTGTSFTGPLKEFQMASGIDVVAFSADSKSILLATTQNSILWNVSDSSSKVLQLQVSGVLPSNSGDPMLVSYKNNSIGLFEWQGNLKQRFEGLTGKIKVVTVSPNSNKYYTGAADGTVILWDKYGNPKKEFKTGDGNEIIAITISKNGEGLFTWSSNNKVRYWPVNKSLESEFTLRSDSGEIISAVFSPSRTSVLTLNSRYFPELWDINGSLIQRFPDLQSKNIDYLEFSSDGTGFLIHYKDSLVRFFTLHGEKVAAVQSGICTGFSPNGKTMLVGDGNHQAKLFDNRGKLIRTLNSPDSSDITFTALSPYNGMMLTGTNNKSFTLWNQDGSLNKVIIVDDAVREGFAQTGAGIVRGAVFSPDNKSVLIELSVPVSRGHVTKYVLVYIAGGAQKVINGTSIAYSPDGKKLVFLISNSIVILDALGALIDYNKLQEYDLNEIATVGFSPDGLKVMTISTNGVIRTWGQVATVEQFLKAGRLDKLTADQKKEFGIE